MHVAIRLRWSPKFELGWNLWPGFYFFLGTGRKGPYMWSQFGKLRVVVSWENEEAA